MARMIGFSSASGLVQESFGGQRCALLTACMALVGCGSSESRPVFGGEGASFEAQQTPLSEAPPETATGPCAQAAPPSETTLIEDFEDTDNQMFKAFQREGWWYVAVDETSGSVFPNVGEFAATALPAEEATAENRYALYGKADGFRDWGVVWGTTTRWVNDGLKCAFNASNFEGLTFRVKGKGSLHLKIGNPATTPPEYEGNCKERCWDTHGKRFALTDEWQQVIVRWDRVQQGGWGAQAQFDPERLLTLNFGVEGKSLPVEFWLDDLYFLQPGQPVPTLVPDAAAAQTAPPTTAASTTAPPAASATAAPPTAAPTTAPPTAAPRTAAPPTREPSSP